MKRNQKGIITLVFVLATALVGTGLFNAGAEYGKQAAAQSQTKKSDSSIGEKVAEAK